GHAFKSKLVIMKVAHDGEARIEPGSVWLVEVWRADVLGPAEACPVANGQVVAAHHLQPKVKGPLWNIKGPEITWADQRCRTRLEILVKGSDAEGQRMLLRRPGSEGRLRSFSEFTIPGRCRPPLITVRRLCPCLCIRVHVRVTVELDVA